ncbi:hypothetical protein EW026_g7476 [Hermanssonia centrifuga]|uniref:Uncharacterized protein n=1 Tax=Hermanssonia centrifuga TaxID=98765 RepID=A0A4S4K7P5_9APHY|nr:hypothetical protein EW026_g7476 [Hermanssonia centrifuga]
MRKYGTAHLQNFRQCLYQSQGPEADAVPAYIYLPDHTIAILLNHFALLRSANDLDVHIVDRTFLKPHRDKLWGELCHLQKYFDVLRKIQKESRRKKSAARAEVKRAVIKKREASSKAGAEHEGDEASILDVSSEDDSEHSDLSSEDENNGDGNSAANASAAKASSRSVLNCSHNILSSQFTLNNNTPLTKLSIRIPALNDRKRKRTIEDETGQDKENCQP